MIEDSKASATPPASRAEAVQHEMLPCSSQQKHHGPVDGKEVIVFERGCERNSHVEDGGKEANHVGHMCLGVGFVSSSFSRLLRSPTTKCHRP